MESRQMSATRTDRSARRLAGILSQRDYVCPKCGKTLHVGKGTFGTHVKFCDLKMDAAWFWPRVDRSAGPDACWPWQRSISSWGYGTIHFKGKNMGAHKLAWVLTNGEVPAGICVLHKCDNRPCCNPAHLYLGDKKQNSADAIARGRHACGEKTLKNKLTEVQVREILLLRPAKRTYGLAKGIAAKYGVNHGAISSIWRRASWKHLKEAV